MKILTLLAVCLALAGCATQPRSSTTNEPRGSSEARPPPPERAAIEITAAELFQAYEKNELAADDLYKGKPLVVTGTIESISKDPSGEMYVMLKSEKDFSIADIQCFFSEDQKAELTKLQKGQKVKVKCSGAGKSLNVELRSCAIVAK